MKLWMMRSTGDKGITADDFLNYGIIAIQGEFIEDLDLNDYHTKEDFNKLISLREEIRGTPHSGVAVHLYRFGKEMQIGDWVTTHDESNNRFYIGTIKSDYIFFKDERDGLRHQRKVQWKDRLGMSRKKLTKEVKEGIKSRRTVFEIKGDIAKEFLSLYGIKSS